MIFSMFSPANENIIISHNWRRIQYQVSGSVVDLFVWSMCQFPLYIFLRVMGLSTGGRFMLSAWNEAKKIKHRG